MRFANQSHTEAERRDRADARFHAFVRLYLITLTLTAVGLSWGLAE